MINIFLPSISKISKVSNHTSKLLHLDKEVFVMATLSPSLFHQIAKTGISEEANNLAIQLFIKSHKKSIFSTSL